MIKKWGVIVLLAVGMCWNAGNAYAADKPVVTDVVQGKKVFKKKCKICHSFTKNKLGPALGTVFDQKAGSVEKYKYSKAMKNSEVIWNTCNLDDFLANPKKYIKGTKMVFKGLKKQSDREVVIEFLKENQIK